MINDPETDKLAESNWPAAESMLNDYYKKKRRRIFFLWFFAALMMVSGGYYLNRTYDVKNDSVRNDQKQIDVTNRIVNNDDTKIGSETIHSETETNTSKTGTNTNASNTGDLSESLIKTNTANAKAEPLFTTWKSTAIKSSVSPETSIQSPASYENTLVTETLNYMPFLNSQLFATENSGESVINSVLIKTEPLKPQLDLIVLAGACLISKDMSGSNSDYLERRHKEESDIILPSFSVMLSKPVNHFNIRAGLQFSLLGEKADYSPYTDGEYYNTHDHWEPTQYMLTDTDSIYIIGMLYLHTTSVIIDDSVLTSVTDTLNGIHYNNSILTANGTHVKYVAEFPLEVSYNFLRGRFGAGVFTSLLPGFVLNSTGYVLREDQQNIVQHKTVDQYAFLLSARAGLEFSYLTGDRCRVLMRPSYYTNLNAVSDRNAGKSKYHATGVQVGVQYRLCR